MADLKNINYAGKIFTIPTGGNGTDVEYFHMRAWYDYSINAYDSYWEEEQQEGHSVIDAIVDAYRAGKVVKVVLTTSNEDIYYRNVLDLVKYTEQGEEPYWNVEMLFANKTVSVSTSNDGYPILSPYGFEVSISSGGMVVSDTSVTSVELAYAGSGMYFNQKIGQVSMHRAIEKDRDFKIIQQTPTSDTVEIEATTEYWVDPDDEPDSGDEYKETQYQIKASLATKEYVDNKVYDDTAIVARVTAIENNTTDLSKLTITMVDSNNVTHVYEVLGREVTQ